jgi:hypothetical protein
MSFSDDAEDEGSEKRKALERSRLKDRAGEEGRTPDLMLGKHGRRKMAL